MVEKKSRKPPSRSEKTRDPRAVTNFLEELSWLLQSHSNIDFRALQDLRFVNPTSQSPSPLDNVKSGNENIHFLVGTLPIIFNNARYFPANEDIVDFANGALGLNIARWGKRSRYELIGIIVCETAKLDDERLGTLVRALARVTGEDANAAAIMVQRKENSMSWNELIQLLNSSKK